MIILIVIQGPLKICKYLVKLCDITRDYWMEQNMINNPFTGTVVRKSALRRCFWEQNGFKDFWKKKFNALF